MSGWTDADLAALRRTAWAIRDAETTMRQQVAFLRQSGCPWSVIGECLGVTKQSAQRKYRSSRVSLEDRPLPAP